MKLTPEQIIILNKIGVSGGIATHWIAGEIKKSCSQARYQLRKMQGLGLVEGITAQRSGRVYWWKLTDAGRAALAQGGDK